MITWPWEGDDPIEQRSDPKGPYPQSVPLAPPGSDGYVVFYRFKAHETRAGFEPGGTFVLESAGGVVRARSAGGTGGSDSRAAPPTEPR